MIRCDHCGTEYEGNVCPLCGKSNNATSSNSEILAAQAKRVCNILAFVPHILAALFSLLLFAFFAAPVSEMLGISGGTVYQLLQVESESRATWIAYIALAAVFSLLSLLSLIPALRRKSITSFLGYLPYITFLVSGSMKISQFSGIEAKLLMVSPGACPILLVTFSVIFLVCATGAMILQYFLAKKYSTESCTIDSTLKKAGTYLIENIFGILYFALIIALIGVAIIVAFCT